MALPNWIRFWRRGNKAAAAEAAHPEMPTRPLQCGCAGCMLIALGALRQKVVVDRAARMALFTIEEVNSRGPGRWHVVLIDDVAFRHGAMPGLRAFAEKNKAAKTGGA